MTYQELVDQLAKLSDEQKEQKAWIYLNKQMHEVNYLATVNPPSNFVYILPKGQEPYNEL